MAVINFIRNDGADVSSVVKQDGQVVLNINGESVELYHDFEKNGVLKRALISGGGGSDNYLGITTTQLTDGATTSPIQINGESVTPVAGNTAIYGSKEFIFNGVAWQEFGDLTGLGSLAYKSNAQTSYTPAGTISQPTTTVTTSDITVNSITDVGILPSFTVIGETLVFNAGTLPTKGANTKVLQNITGVTTTQPTFSGTQATIQVS